MTHIVPLIPLRELVLFPQVTVPLFVGRDKTMNAVDEACSKDKLVMVTTQKDKELGNPAPSDIYDIGVLAKIEDVISLPDGVAKISVKGICRARIIHYFDSEKMMQVEIEEIPQHMDENLGELMISVLKSYESRILKHKRPKDAEKLMLLKDIKDPSTFVGELANCIDIKIEEKQRILETDDLSTSLKELIKFI
jgi:ATP-dependent Lon protease